MTWIVISPDAPAFGPRGATRRSGRLAARDAKITEGAVDRLEVRLRAVPSSLGIPLEAFDEGARYHARDLQPMRKLGAWVLKKLLISTPRAFSASTKGCRAKFGSPGWWMVTITGP